VSESYWNMGFLKIEHVVSTVNVYRDIQNLSHYKHVLSKQG